MDIIPIIEGYAATAKRGAILRLSRRSRRCIRRVTLKTSLSYIRPIDKPLPRHFSSAEILEEAIITTLEFGALTNQTALYMMREMETARGYEDLGYPDLREWAYTKLAHVKSRDTLARLCSATLNIVATLDVRPVITSEGEKIDGLQVIAQSSASSLMKLSGMFATSLNGDRAKLVQGLITGTSDAKKIKESIGWQPRIGKAVAVFSEYTENEQPMTDIHIRCTYEQSKVIEKSIGWLCEIRFTEPVS